MREKVIVGNRFSSELVDDILRGILLDPTDDDGAADFPELYNLSVAFMFDLMPRPLRQQMPEFAYVNMDDEDQGADRGADGSTARWSRRSMSLLGSVANWNMAWEAGHLRPEWLCSRDDLAAELKHLAKYEGRNLYLLPRTSQTRYYAWAPLFHLLPVQTLQRFGLPLIKRGLWPQAVPQHWLEQVLPADSDARLAQAFAHHVWPLLSAGSRMHAFSKDDPLKLLAHNVDFWLPYAYQVSEDRMRAFDRCDFEDDEQRQAYERAKADLLMSDEKNLIAVDRPLKGGPVWVGEEEAWSATEDMVELADAGGRLRDLIDAVKSNRVEDDFSPVWSWAREDFERKLYHKRSKIKVNFVELEDTIPVHGPEAEVHEDLLWEDFLALLDQKERRIVICLRSGTTRVGEISKVLGYSSHSPVSKALARIRTKAMRWLA